MQDFVIVDQFVTNAIFSAARWSERAACLKQSWMMGKLQKMSHKLILRSVGLRLDVLQYAAFAVKRFSIF